MIAWGNAPGLVNPKAPALKSAIHLLNGTVEIFIGVTRAFSASLPDDANSQGDALGWDEAAPLALTCSPGRYPSIERNPYRTGLDTRPIWQLESLTSLQIFFRNRIL
jgi:hypothetical protein